LGFVVYTVDDICAGLEEIL